LGSNDASSAYARVIICLNCGEKVVPGSTKWWPDVFCKSRCYVEYMTKNSLWGTEEYAKKKGGWDKRLFK